MRPARRSGSGRGSWRGIGLPCLLPRVARGPPGSPARVPETRTPGISEDGLVALFEEPRVPILHPAPDDRFCFLRRDRVTDERAKPLREPKQSGGIAQKGHVTSRPQRSPVQRDQRTNSPRAVGPDIPFTRTSTMAWPDTPQVIADHRRQLDACVLPRLMSFHMCAELSVVEPAAGRHRGDLAARGLRRAADFSWERCARETLGRLSRGWPSIAR